MELIGDAKMLRIFLGSLDIAGGKPLYEAIVQLAHKQGMAGATVLKGVMGFGASSLIRTAKTLSLSDDMPVVIEVVDSSDKIDAFVSLVNPYLEHSFYGGLIMMEKVNVLYYKGAQT